MAVVTGVSVSNQFGFKPSLIFKHLKYFLVLFSAVGAPLNLFLTIYPVYGRENCSHADQVHFVWAMEDLGAAS